MEKLELKHLAPYLPYGLKFYVEHANGTPLDAWEMTIDTNLRDVIKFQNKPILRPLSDLRKYLSDDVKLKVNEHSINMLIGENDTYGRVMIQYWRGDLDFIIEADGSQGYDSEKSIDFKLFEKVRNELLKNHYDIFGLIDKELAMDINMLNKQ